MQETLNDVVRDYQRNNSEFTLVIPSFLIKVGLAFGDMEDEEREVLEMIDDMKMFIYEGNSIDLPIYNHKNGNHEPPLRIEPARVVILDGIMSLQYELRERFTNLNIFFVSDDIVIRGLRLLVDMEERGYSVFEALAHSDEEFAHYNKWVYPQITFAHIKIWIGKNRELSILPKEVRSNKQ